MAVMVLRELRAVHDVADELRSEGQRDLGLVREAVQDPAKKPAALRALAAAEARRQVYLSLAYRQLGEFDAAFDRIERPMLTHGDYNSLRDLWGKDARAARAAPVSRRGRTAQTSRSLAQVWMG